jgi:NDP-sugar pyrophosphorylase family protein
MKAIILAAGLGTRLRPLTERKPKALIPVVNRPIIARNIEYLKGYGIDGIAVNAHHHYKQIRDYMDGGTPFGIDAQVLIEPEILGTGGGIRNCSGSFKGDGPFFVINSDILTNIDLYRALEHHRRSGSIASLILHDHEPYNQILVDNNSRILDIEKRNLPDRLAFTGIHILEPEILSFIPDSGYSDIIDCYMKVIQKSNNSINAFISKGHYWHDIGMLKDYVKANQEILNLQKKSFASGSETRIDPSALLEEWAVIGKGSILEKGVRLKRSIIWDNVRIKENTSIADSVITSSRVIQDDLSGAVH